MYPFTPLVHIIEGTLGGQCMVHHSYMKKIGTPVPSQGYRTQFQYNVMKLYIVIIIFNALNSEMAKMKANTQHSQLSVVDVSSIDGSEYLRLLWLPTA